jgi:sulfatase maturation enzyme AslB (radical SAM superfamily)
MRAGFLPARVVHLHLTRRCNLACLHCYSTSSPTERDHLQLAQIVSALKVLRQQGYEIVSLSGGEPLLYRALEELMSEAVALGYRVNMVSNGIALGERRFRSLRENVNLVAISIDGRPEEHNALRGRADSFARAESALDLLADEDVPTAVAYCVSRDSLADVPWAYEFAESKGARLLHLHPLVATGRAVTTCQDKLLSNSDKERLFLTASILDTGAPGEPRVQVDLVAVESLAEAGCALDDTSDTVGSGMRLSDVANPLIVTERGDLVPFAYGLNPIYQIANLGEELDRSLARYWAERRGQLTGLLAAAFEQLTHTSGAYVEWYEHLVNVSFMMQATGESTVASVPARHISSADDGGASQ